MARYFNGSELLFNAPLNAIGLTERDLEKRGFLEGKYEDKDLAI